MRARVLALAAVVGTLVAVAVLPGWAAGQQAAGIARLGLGAEQPTRAQLAVMVLPKDALGSAARGLDVDLDCGFTDNAAAADATLDPTDTAGQLTRAGRVAGYDLSYSDLSLVPLARGSGLLAIGSSVDLFESNEAAGAFLTKQVRDAQRLRGKRLEPGVGLVASGTFPAGRIGDRSVGLRETVAMFGKRMYGTIVGFRIGALVAGVEVERTDAKDVTPLAKRLARLLAARVRLAAGGKLNAQPVALAPIARKAQPPAGGPDLAAMALTLRDLPKGTTLVRQGYVDDDTSIGSYEREFDTSSARFGADMVESDISLFRNTKEASGFLVLLRTGYTWSGAEQMFAQEFDEPDLEVEQQPNIKAGDEAVAIVLQFPAMDIVPTRVALIHVRVGRTMGTLIVAGVAKSFRFTDAKPLADTLAKRMGNGR